MSAPAATMCVSVPPAPPLFNPLNRPLTPDAAAELLQRYGVVAKPRNLALYQRAFVHKSYCLRRNDSGGDGNAGCPPKCVPLHDDSYERQEFLGDAVLNIIVTDYLYRRYFYEGEGFLTRMRTKLINGVFLGNLATEIGLAEHVVVAASVEAAGGRTNIKTLEDVFEALLGAIFEDFNATQCGFETARTWLTNVLEAHVDFTALVLQNHNHKERLLRYMQTHVGALPRFEERRRAGQAGTFMAVLEPGGETIGIGHGDTRKAAEQDAALRALEYYGASEAVP